MLTALMGGELSVSSAPGAGAVFHVKLFLPEVHADVLGKALPLSAAVEARQPRTRTGYAGEHRRILVVDNEEPDRELLVQLLEPLGFTVRQAASGHDALDLLAAGYRPHAIFMDLAMPGIDGWETLRRVRQMQRSATPGADAAPARAWGPVQQRVTIMSPAASSAPTTVGTQPAVIATIRPPRVTARPKPAMNSLSGASRSSTVSIVRSSPVISLLLCTRIR